jgi:hypothetical protein
MSGLIRGGTFQAWEGDPLRSGILSERGIVPEFRQEITLAAKVLSFPKTGNRYLSY